MGIDLSEWNPTFASAIDTWWSGRGKSNLGLEIICSLSILEVEEKS